MQSIVYQQSKFEISFEHIDNLCSIGKEEGKLTLILIYEGLIVIGGSLTALERVGRLWRPRHSGVGSIEFDNF